MPNQEEQNKSATEGFDYSYVPATARVAVYDDMKMAPRVIDVEPAPTKEFIETLADVVSEHSRRLGGKIPYSVVREVSENFIHARFTEMVVSILDGGDTIRFCDQGPGIKNKEKATQPGFTSAVEPMKEYIRGVGSGLPLVKEWLDVSNGQISIEDNIDTGTVVTITLMKEPAATPRLEPAVELPRRSAPIPPLTERERLAIELFAEEGALGVTEICNLTGLAASSAHSLMKKLEENNLIMKTANKKRMLTDWGFEVAQRLGA